MAQRRGRYGVGRRQAPLRVRRAVASLALLAGGMSGGIVSPAGSPAAAAPREVPLICTGESGDIAGNFADPEYGDGGLDSESIVGLLTTQDPTGASPLSMVTVTVDHDLPDLMTTDDAARPVNLSGTARLSDAFLAAMRSLQNERPFQVDASVRADLDGPGVSLSHDQGTSSTLTQPIDGPGAGFPVDLDLTATPTADGGSVALHLSSAWKLHLDQEMPAPIPLELGTVSMTCETAGPLHDLAYPYDDEELPDSFQPSIRLPQPLADSYVARPSGVVARTDRAFENTTSAMIDVLGNDESLDPERVIDPSSLKIMSASPADHWDAEVSLHDNSIMVSPDPLSVSDMYEDFETMDGGWGGIPSPPPGINQMGFAAPLLTLNLVYEICDDGAPASCAQGLAEVTVRVELIDPCDDPTLDIDCGPDVLEPDTTCADDMSICEVPGCTWSNDENRYVCVYPGTLQHDPTDPPDPRPMGDDQPLSKDKPPDGTGPGDDRQPPPGVPLTPAFTA